MTRNERKQFRAGLGFTSLWIFGLAAFTAYPVIASLYYSFCDYSILKSPVWCGLENYSQLVHDGLFWKSLRNTLFYAGLSVPLGTAVALGLAVLLNCEVRGKSAYRLLFFMPSIVPIVASSMLWLWIFNGQYGLMNGFLNLFLRPLGLHGPAWLADPAWAKPALIIMSLWSTGNAVVIYLAGLQNVPMELYEAAEIDGATAWQRFVHVTLPTIAPVVTFNAIMALIGAMQLFAQAYIMSEGANGNGNASDGNPARSTLFYTIYLFSTAFQDLRMGYASAMAYILFVITAVLTWLAARLTRGTTPADMRPKTKLSRAIVTGLLLLCSAAFVAPFIWLISTSLKPIEQTLTLPISFLPKAYYADLGGRRMEVTIDYQLAQSGAVVRFLTGDDAGKLGFMSDAQMRARPDAFAAVHPVAAGSWHVSQRLDREIGEAGPAPAWDIITRDRVEAHVKFRWANYPRALAALGGDAEADRHRVGFWTFLGNSLTVAVLGVLGTVISNAIVAYGFARLKWRGRDAFFALTLATMMVPFPVLMVPLYGVFRTFGLIGTLLPLWLPTWFGSAFNIFLMRQFFRTIPEELSEAARIDGCSEWRIFWRIIVPLSTPVLVVAALFHFIFAWNDFLGPLLYLTRKDTYTLAIALESYESQNGGVQWHYLMAASAVTILPVIILFLLAQKTFIRGIATTGSKS